jgi:hypothetical protein
MSENEKVYGIKRKSEYPINRDSENEKVSETKTPQKTFEECRASEEVLKTRKIVKVVRDEMSAPKGRFTFGIPNHGDVSPSEEKKEVEEGNSNVNVNASNFNTSQDNKMFNTSSSEIKSTGKKIISTRISLGKSDDKQPDKEPTIKEETKQEDDPKKEQIKLTENKINQEKSSNIKREIKNEFPTINPFGICTNPFKNPFLTNVQTNNQTKQNPPADNQIKQNPPTDNQIPNPFTNYKKNTLLDYNDYKKQLDSFNKNLNTSTETNNPINSAIASIFGNKPVFNFNQKQAQRNPNWDSDEEEGEINLNPEQEIEIKPNGSKPNLLNIIPKSNTLKLIRFVVEDFSLYDFNEKKYHSKGKGEFSVELTKNEKGDKISAVGVFRGSTTILFNGVIVSNVTKHEVKPKDYNNLFLIHNLLEKVNEKIERRTAKLSFPTNKSQSECKKLEEQWLELERILSTNDVSIFNHKLID